jgi:cell division protein FtsZ
MHKSFAIAPKIKTSVILMAGCLLAPGEIDIGWDYIRDVLLQDRKTVIAFGSGTGKNRAVKACQDALGSYRSAAGTTMMPARLLFRAVGPEDLLLKEVNDAREMIDGSLSPASEMIFGVALDDSLKDEVRITMLGA